MKPGGFKLWVNWTELCVCVLFYYKDVLLPDVVAFNLYSPTRSVMFTSMILSLVMRMCSITGLFFRFATPCTKIAASTTVVKTFTRAAHVTRTEDNDWIPPAPPLLGPYPKNSAPTHAAVCPEYPMDIPMKSMTSARSCAVRLRQGMK